MVFYKYTYVHEKKIALKRAIFLHLCIYIYIRMYVYKQWSQQVNFKSKFLRVIFENIVRSITHISKKVGFNVLQMI